MLVNRNAHTNKCYLSIVECMIPIETGSPNVMVTVVCITGGMFSALSESNGDYLIRI